MKEKHVSQPERDQRYHRFARRLDAGWRRDVTVGLAESLHYQDIDRLSLEILWLHWLALLGLVWLDEVVRLPDYLPSPLGWQSMQPPKAFILVGSGLFICGLASLLARRLTNHYAWRIVLALSLASFSSLFVAATSGSDVMRFHYFIVMAYLIIYADWRLSWWAMVVILGYLGTFSLIDPHLVYSYGRNDLSLFVHAVMLAIMAVVTTVVCKKYRNVVLALQEAKRRNDEFLAIASHELKTPLTSLKGYMQVLQQRLRRGNDPMSVEYATKVYYQLNRLVGLVRDLLDVSKIQAGKMEFRQERIGVDGLMAEVIEEVQALSPQHHIRLEGRSSLPIVGDRERLYQVMLNLLTNAVKYSPGKDEVVVRVMEARDKLVISVQDFGIGIALQDQQRVFEPYFRASDVKRDELPGGMGMGLYICSEIVQLHRGRMWVESEPGKGSTFSFYLPVVGAMRA